MTNDLETDPQWEGDEERVTLGLYPGIKVYGTLGATYAIECADSPTTNIWHSLGSLTLTNQGQLCIDTTITNTVKRFDHSACRILLRLSGSFSIAALRGALSDEE